MHRYIFKGAATALVTPMDESGIDYDSLGTLIDWQISEGIDGLVIAGTTGEGPTLTDTELGEVVGFAVEKSAGRVPIIAGAGTNDVAHGLRRTRIVCKAGADAILVVTPYYNKCTQNGLVKLYSEYSDTSTVPIILYNVPSRTGVNIQPETYEKLAEIDKIAAIKESNGDFSGLLDTVDRIGDRLDLYSGNDDQIIPILSLGGIGVISVLSNILPRQTHEMVTAYLDNDVKRARELQIKYNKIICAIFSEVNPIPIKAALSCMGYCKNILRPPLYPMESENEKALRELLKKESLI